MGFFLWLYILIMQWFKICILQFSKPTVNILLCSAAAAPFEDMGTFPHRLAVGDAVFIFCDLHRVAPFVFLRIRKRMGFYTSFGEICFV